MQWASAYKYKGTLDDFRKHFFTAIDAFNEKHHDRFSPIIGKIDEEKIEIAIEAKHHSEGYWYISSIQKKDGELRFEGIIKSNSKMAVFISIMRDLLFLVFLPFLIIFWIIKKAFGLPSKLSKGGKLHKLMIDYVGCEPSLLVETENQIDELKQYLSTNKKFTGAIDVVSPSTFKIRFNEYLLLDIYFESQYDEAYVDFNGGFSHWHPMGNQVLKDIMDIVDGTVYFIQPRTFLKKFDLKILVNEKEMRKYLGKKNIRIYNNKIIQRSKR